MRKDKPSERIAVAGMRFDVVVCRPAVGVAGIRWDGVRPKRGNGLTGHAHLASACNEEPDKLQIGSWCGVQRSDTKCMWLEV